ncbi:hypothetical protein ACLQ2S_24995 [Micromonospora sp. DT48]|uniref:hypothetical protein n=1 Tax=Micromonospora sp. DT48 TaxID=3393429 RepID=UPI003CECCD4F
MATALPAMLSCFGKLLRARELFGQVTESASEFRKHDHYEIVRFDNARSATDELVRVQWRINILNPVPEDWAYLTGDAVNNMRSALDHALAVVARQRLGFSDTDVQKHRLQFPICDTSDSFAAVAKNLVKILPQDLVDQLEKLQPYHGDPDDSVHNLAMVRDLSNLDKHRRLTVVAHGVYRSRVTIEPPMDVVSLKENTGALADGMVLATVKFRRPVNPPELTLTPEIRYVESLFIPGSNTFVPLAVALELMFEEAFIAVESLTRDLMGAKDIMFAKVYLDDREARTRGLLATLATAAEIESLSQTEGAAS